MTHDHELLPPGLEPPAPPAALRGRALAAARTAFDAPVPDGWTRLFRSPALRLAWAASVALLLAAHLAVRPRAPRGAPRVSRPDPEITAIARLPRIDERTLARAGASL